MWAWSRVGFALALLYLTWTVFLFTYAIYFVPPDPLRHGNFYELMMPLHPAHLAMSWAGLGGIWAFPVSIGTAAGYGLVVSLTAISLYLVGWVVGNLATLARRGASFKLRHRGIN
jgi:hypothetical protein